ncbi:MAG TPA: MFS transporter [Solirubrobacteraceae bacterium]|jgi:MFS family permease
MSNATAPSAAPTATRSPRGRLSHPIAFGAIASILVWFAAASSAPSPLYVVYQQEWSFSPTTLTVVFAVYVVGLLGSLLVLGALSDHVGRRPVLLAAIGLESIALVIFIAAGDVTVLAIARVAQGIATGAAFTTLGAALVDLNPAHAPTRAGLINGVAPLGGLAFGALGCGALVQFGPAPTHLVYAVLLTGMVVAAAVVSRMPETSARRAGARASLRPRVGVPPRLRTDFFAIVPILVASWALGGLYLSLGPSVAASLFGLDSHLIGGLVVTLLCGTGAATAFFLRAWPIERVIVTAAGLLAGGMVVTLIGVEADSAVLAAAGTVVAGIGFGASALGCFGTLARLAAPDERGELFAVALVIAYVAFSLPAVLAGFASTSFGLRPTTVVYGLAVIALGVAALGAQRVLAARRRAVPA